MIWVFLTCVHVSQGQKLDSTAQKLDSLGRDLTYYFDEARILKNQNKLDLAIKSVEKAAELAEVNDDVKALIDSYNKFALLYLELGKDQDRALFFLDRAKTLLKDVEYPYGNAIYRYVDALVLFKNEKSFQALLVLEQAKQLNNDRNFFNTILLVEGDIYTSLEKYDVASKNYNSLIVNTDIYEKEYLATRAYLGLAALHYKTEEFDVSVENAEEALKLAEANNFFKEIYDANVQLTQSYEILGSFDNALAKNRELLKIKDSIFNIEKI